MTQQPFPGARMSYPVPIPKEETVVAGNPFDDPLPPVNRPRMSIPIVSMPTSMAQPRGPFLQYAPPPYQEQMPPYYLEHQTMNSTSAQPIHLCKMCKTEIRDDESQAAIQCASRNGCNCFFHLRCTKLSEQAHKLLMEEPFAEWVCDECFAEKNIDLIDAV